MTDNEKVKAMMKDLGLVSYRDIAKITGHNYEYVKFALQPNIKIPRWVNLVLFAWENKYELSCDNCKCRTMKKVIPHPYFCPHCGSRK